MPAGQEKKATPGVAAEQENRKLKHSQGGMTTRDDALDSGVPMLPGDPSEPAGPEDALGAGPKRGDYSGVMGDRQFYRSVRNPDHDPSDPTSPAVVLEHQNPHVAERGDVKGKKGGVDTADES